MRFESAHPAMGACASLPCLPLCSPKFARTRCFCCCPCLFDGDGEPKCASCLCDGWDKDEIAAMGVAVRRIQRPVF